MNAKNKQLTSSYVETATFDNAIALTGYGRFHYKIITLCFTSVLAIGLQNGLSSYVFPAAQCELKLSSFQLGLLNVCFLSGGTLSCFLWGILADVWGRRRILIITHLLNAIITIICSVVPYTASLVVCRLLNGFLIGGPGSIIFSYLAEFQPVRYRSRCVCYCGLFFTLAWLLLPIFAYLILPLEVDFGVPQIFLISPWRLFMMLVALPEFIVGVCFLMMPESPKFYLAKGDPRKALAVLRKMYSANTGRSSELFPVKHLVGEVRIEARVSEKIACRAKSIRIFAKICYQVPNLFRRPLMGVTALICSIMFANMFGMFGLGLWLPELFVRFKDFQDLHPNMTITVKQLSRLPVAQDAICQPSFDESVIKSTIAMAASSLVYNGFSSWVSIKITTRTITMTSMFLGGLASGSIFWLTSSAQNLVVACVFQATMITANMTIASMGVELFPTNINGVAICLIMCSGRIGASVSNVLFGYLVDDHCEIPIFVVAVIVLAGGTLCFLVPNTNRSEKETNKNNSCNIFVISHRIKM